MAMTETRQKEVQYQAAGLALSQLLNLTPAQQAEVARALPMDVIRGMGQIVHAAADALVASGNGVAEIGEAMRQFEVGPGPLTVVTAAGGAPAALKPLQEPARAPIPEGQGFGWRKLGKGEKARYEGQHGPFRLEVLRHGPADYEGKINGESVAKGKFKKGVRERVEREAVKRA